MLNDLIKRNGTALALALAMVPFGALAQDDAAETEPETTSETGDAATASDLANNTTFGDWVVTCEAATVRRNVCRLEQEQSLRETGQFVARFIAVPVSDGVILLAQTPMGTYLPGGAVYRFADDAEAEQREMVWQRCLGQICEAAAPLDEAELEKFGTSDALLFGFRMDAEAEPIVLRVDISQFTDAVAALRAASADN